MWMHAVPVVVGWMDPPLNGPEGPKKLDFWTPSTNILENLDSLPPVEFGSRSEKEQKMHFVLFSFIKRNHIDVEMMNIAVPTCYCKLIL